MAKSLHFNITLKNSKAPIWRTLIVTDDFRMDRFHQVILIAIGWFNAHLHEFKIKDLSIGIVLDAMFDAPEVEDETKLFLKDFGLVT